ncbi:MAG: dipeptidase [Anaerolineae bacterium]|nr:dipeptidase [Anaerolineae bacterium]
MDTNYLHQHADRFEQELIELLKIPSVSTLPEHESDVKRAAHWLSEQLQQIGLHAQIFQQDPYLPIVYGQYQSEDESAPTVLIYGHYDVQPAAIEDGWESDPFIPVKRGDRLYARGAVDSKSHVIIQLKAIEALIQSGRPNVNIKILLEGEEESGSEHIFAFVREHADLLHADVIVVSDGSMPDPHQPMLVYGLRGLVSMELVITGPQRDLHSGHFGGTVHNPILALAQILTQCHDSHGRVIVPGFYDEVRPISEEERAVLSASASWFEREWRAVANAPLKWGDPDFALNERIGARPTLEINGIGGGFAGNGFKTVLPAHANAKISCRLVPDQDPAKIYHRVHQHLLSLAPPTVQIELHLLDAGSPGVLLDRHNPYMRAVEQAYLRGWGVRPLYSREGGSIPVVSAFQQHLHGTIVLMPFGYKGGGAHSTNEYVIMEMFHKGIITMLHFFEAI